jgi:selenocysteine lyase/cysteine desulfurase
VEYNRLGSRREFVETTRWIRQNEVGRHTRIETPFGQRLISYADLTATGRYLYFVDEWVRRTGVFYANTHTAVSSTGSLFTTLRERARQIVHRAVGASGDDEVVFAGSGATAAVNKLVGLLGWRISEPLDRDHGLSDRIPEKDRPVIFVGPYEHHSNLLPWLESVADVVEIGLDGDGLINVGELDARLNEYGHRTLKAGSFSAASNVTGVLSDVSTLARVLHRNDAWAFFDYAAAGPYVPIDMHPPDPEERIDALFLSPHKFIGGPEGSGVLVANRQLFRSTKPERPGGGSVDYVAGATHSTVDYVAGLAEREEGGTPAIMGDLRTGAAFLVKQLIGAEEILRHEVDLASRAIERLEQHPRIKLLGPTRLPRLAILSLTIPELHHDFASTLLDHLFGIQNRAGCSCAGPYGHLLLGIDFDTSTRFRQLVQRGLNGMKPGWIRVSIPYYASEDDVEFILSAVEFVAEHGLDFLPLYRANWRTGVWTHIERSVPAAPGVDLTVESLKHAAEQFAGTLPESPLTETELKAERTQYFEQVRDQAVRLRARWKGAPPRWNAPTGDREIDRLVWFRYAHSEGL